MHVHDRPDVDLLWGRIRATGLCTRPTAGIPLGVFVALHLCDEARTEGRPPPRTVTRRVLREIQDFHDPALHLAGTMPVAPKLMRRMYSIPDWAGSIWTTPAAKYRIDHGSECLIGLDSPRHARLVVNAAGMLCHLLALAGVPDARDLPIEFETSPYGSGFVDGVEMSLSGIVGGSPAQVRRGARHVAECLAVARSDETIETAARMQAVLGEEARRSKMPDLLVGVRCGSVRAAHDEEDGPRVSWYSVALSGLGEDLLPRRWSIVAEPRTDSVGENMKEAIRTERRLRRIAKRGARVEAPLLAAIGMDAVRDLYAETSAWMRENKLPPNRLMPASRVPKRFPEGLDQVTLRSGVLSASLELARGIRWSQGRLTLGRAVLPESVLAALPGMRVGTVLEHPWIDAEPPIEWIRWKGNGYVLKTDVRTVEVPGGNPARGEEN